VNKSTDQMKIYEKRLESIEKELDIQHVFGGSAYLLRKCDRVQYHGTVCKIVYIASRDMCRLNDELGDLIRDHAVESFGVDDCIKAKIIF